MHSCLQIPELIASICLELDRDSSRQTVATLAQTCKAFTTPALSLLWQKQSSFVPLLRCFPSDVVAPATSQPSNAVSTQTLRFRRALLPEDWTRPMMYSRFITDIMLWEPEAVFGGLDDKELQSLHLSLAARCPDSPLLPNLKRFRYQGRVVRPAAYPFLALAQGSRLESLLYQNNGAAPFAPELDLIRSIAHASPNLTEFVCSGLAEQMSPAQACLNILLDSLQQLPKLKSASLPCYYPFVKHLATLPSLTSLYLEGRAYCPFAPPGQSNDIAYEMVHQFTGLKHLALDFGTLEQMNCFLSHVTFLDCPLETFSLQLQHSCADPTDQLRLLKLLSAKSPTSEALTSVSLCIRYASEAPLVTIAELLDVVVKTRGLETLEILLPELLVHGLSCPLAGNALVRSVAQRWSGLRELTMAPCFNSLEGAIKAEQTTLVALKVLAEHCPDLVFLQIAIDATKGIPDLDAHGHDSGQETGVVKYVTKHRQQIELGFTEPSPVERSDAQSIAEYLRRVFYRVGIVDVDESSRWKDVWDEVDELIQEAQSEDDDDDDEN